MLVPIVLENETEKDVAEGIVKVVVYYNDLDGSRHAEFYESYKLAGNIYMTFYADDIGTIEVLRQSEEYPGKYESEKIIVSIAWNEQTEQILDYIDRMSAVDFIRLLAEHSTDE
jgi:hypothetical protein